MKISIDKEIIPHFENNMIYKINQKNSIILVNKKNNLRIFSLRLPNTIIKMNSFNNFARIKISIKILLHRKLIISKMIFKNKIIILIKFIEHSLIKINFYTSKI